MMSPWAAKFASGASGKQRREYSAQEYRAGEGTEYQQNRQKRRDRYAAFAAKDGRMEARSSTGRLIDRGVRY
jgi:hypothetical protein